MFHHLNKKKTRNNKPPPPPHQDAAHRDATEQIAAIIGGTKTPVTPVTFAVWTGDGGGGEGGGLGMKRSRGLEAPCWKRGWWLEV